MRARYVSADATRRVRGDGVGRLANSGVRGTVAGASRRGEVEGTAAVSGATRTGRSWRGRRRGRAPREQGRGRGDGDGVGRHANRAEFEGTATVSGATRTGEFEGGPSRVPPRHNDYALAAERIRVKPHRAGRPQ